MVKLTLGSAQFGFDYGVTNSLGKVPTSEVDAILNLARDNAVVSIDTASGYGESETVLGELGVRDFNITSKIVLRKKLGGAYKYDELKSNVFKSLEQLKIDSLETLLIHNATELLLYPDLCNKLAFDMKSNGVISSFGVSVYDYKEAVSAVKVCDIDVIQSPLNVFDRRFLNADFQQLLKNHEIIWQVRSIFLQGVLLQGREWFDSYFDFFIKTFSSYEKFLERCELSKLEGALKFVVDQSLVSEIVVGACSRKQFEEVCNAFSKVVALPPVDFSDFECNDERLINPLMWPMLKNN